MFPGKQDEFIYVRLNGIYSTLHGWDGIALTLQTDALTPYSSKFFVCYASSTSCMCSGKITPEYENLIRLE